MSNNPTLPDNLRCMGAICGDVIGSHYEFHRIKRKNFPLFPKSARPTDDSVMTVANMLWLTDPLQHPLVNCMHLLGRRYPQAGYGKKFSTWLALGDTQPYSSYGNGSAMRVSPVAWIGQSLEDILELARQSAAVTHNHPEGIKGAQATATAIFLARTGHSKEDIRYHIERNFHYNLSRLLADIRPSYGFHSSCQDSVPEAIICFLEGTDYEDTVRNAVSLGGDADTQAAIAGAIAEAFYNGVPDNILTQTWSLLPNDMQDIILRFSNMIGPKSGSQTERAVIIG